MTDKVSYLKDEYRQNAEEIGLASEMKKGGGSEPPGGDKLEKRVEKLESALQDVREKLVRIEAKAESIDKHGATKSDLSSMESTLIKWFVATAFALTATTFGIARFLAS